jgi:tagatose-1,6-bisphosphate aldolase non-catalytic subunit AgaZ/GatZ
LTLLAVCPNSAAVLEAAVNVAAQNNAPMLFAATLNQVDRDGGYTGWTPGQFVQQIRSHAARLGWEGPLVPCLDHGGPWLKDLHFREKLPSDRAMLEVKCSITSCLQAGYRLLHIDPTIEPSLRPGESLDVETVVQRTVELMGHAEAERVRLGAPEIAYEVGTEEVHGGLADLSRFREFLDRLKGGLNRAGLDSCWPAFVVAQIGTDLHTQTFDPEVARALTEQVAPTGALLKGHYTDWVDEPEDYPRCGVGAANVGPEFTWMEFSALQRLCRKEAALLRYRPTLEPSGFMEALEQAVVASGRWMKWLLPAEQDVPFSELSSDRRLWLVATGARYVWCQPSVTDARRQLLDNVGQILPDPHGYVVEYIERAIEHYIHAFNLFDALEFFQSQARPPRSSD